MRAVFGRLLSAIRYYRRTDSFGGNRTGWTWTQIFSSSSVFVHAKKRPRRLGFRGRQFGSSVGSLWSGTRNSVLGWTALQTASGAALAIGASQKKEASVVTPFDVAAATYVGFTRDPTGTMQFGFDTGSHYDDDNGSSNPFAMSGESSHSSRRMGVYVVYEVGSETYVRRSDAWVKADSVQGPPLGRRGRRRPRRLRPAERGVGEGVGAPRSRLSSLLAGSATTLRFARRETSHDSVDVIEQLSDFRLGWLLVEDVGALVPEVGQVLDLPPRRLLIDLLRLERVVVVG